VTESRAARRRREDENEILDAALTLFVAQGFHGTSMLQIAERAAFSVGKIYKFFPSKDELFRALQERGRQEFRDSFANAQFSHLPPFEALQAMWRTAFAFASGKRDLIRVQVLERLGRPQGGEQSITGMFRDRTRGLLDQAIVAGELRPLETELLATMIVGACSALVDHLAADEAADPYADIPDRIMDLMIRPHLVRREDAR
jgi:AcrR family transcriptional regulator